MLYLLLVTVSLLTVDCLPGGVGAPSRESWNAVRVL